MKGPASKQPADTEIQGRPTPSALVIGYGNTLRKDDGAGPLVAETVASWNLPGVTSWAVHQLTPEMAEEIAKVDLVIFIDATVLPLATPEIGQTKVEPDPKSTGMIGHVSDPGVILYLAEALYGKRPPASWLITIPAADLELGEGLSPTAKAGVSQAIDRVSALLGREPGPS